MRVIFRFHTLSLKTKLAVYGTAVTLAVVGLLAVLALSVVREDVRRGVTDTQTALVDALKKELDEKISDRKRVVALAAASLSGMKALSPQAIEHYLRERPVLQLSFDAFFFADASGRIIYDLPELPGRRGNSVANRGYFKAVMERGEVVISEPLQGKTTKEPNIVFAAPIRSASGETIGVLGGILFLSRSNFLGDLPEARIGKEGYFALVSKGDRPTILTHKQRDRIMKPVPDAKTSPALWRALAGHEGTVEFVNSQGVEGIYTFRGLESVPWLLFASYPTSEAYAQLRHRERQIVALAAMLALLSGVFLWWFSRRLLSPLDKLTHMMQLQLHQAQPAGAIDAQSEELSQLVSVYDKLMEHKRQSEETLRKSEQKFRGIIDRAGDAFVSINGEGCVTEWNRQAELTFGWTRDEAIGRRLTTLLMPPELDRKFTTILETSSARSGHASLHHPREVAAVDKRGRTIPVEISVTGENDGNGFVAHAFLRDISERKAAEERVADSERRLRTVTDSLPMLIGYIDRKQFVRFINGMSERWLRIKPEAAIHRHLSEVVGGQTYAFLQPQLERALGGERVKFEFEATVRGITGFNQTVYVPDRAEDGSVAGVYALSTDISSLKAVERQLLRLARFDSLTGLPNRAQLHEKLAEATARARRTGAALAVMFLDIDRFKSINDTLGHAVGDEVLQNFAQRLRQSVRETDVVARLAGDEFVIVLEGLNFGEEADLVARKVLLSVSEEMPIAGRMLPVTTSIGIAYCQDGGLDPAALLVQADQALYAAKEAGRNTFHRTLATIAAVGN
ncbi:MAG TPA: diguanylate cyclase [Noviherbaspirillum sp.]|uniref:diguanylate cyclase domain-containing protein n=1 Tax=Noviherbaspirillum sp. TaxID=1926288 RepID=UPI002D62CFB0|nr:diguanylate cyclase [Noviherbaspirillum sp.]HYD94189.1 diguanylate cyclase [Noviherbaspirillum sp.]